VRRKRLQHCADMLCHKFCGWETIFSYRDLVALGSGRLEIDVLHDECSFEGAKIESLSIAGALRAWLLSDLAANQIDHHLLQRATLTTSLALSSIDASARTKGGWHLANGRVIEKGPFHRLQIRCNSEIATDEKTYRSSYEDVKEFPHQWPAV
jgi:hypothetical protein